MEPNHAYLNPPNFERLDPKPDTLGHHVRSYMYRRARWRTQLLTYPVPVRVMDQVRFAELRLPVGLTEREAERVCRLIHSVVTA